MNTHSRVYDSYAQARSVVANLEQEGIPAADISVVANKHVSDEHDDVDDASAAGSGAGLGAAVGGGAGLLAGLGMLAIPGLGPVVAVGWLASTALGIAAGGAVGGLIGSLVDGGESEETAHVYSEAVRRGGTLVTVRANDQTSARVENILDGYEPIDPAVRGADYRRDGWERFDPNGEAYNPNEANVERLRRTSAG
jgi:hypothetical protein